jgi:uncharacterized membrane protein HdeD (DUF308 family)
MEPTGEGRQRPREGQRLARVESSTWSGVVTMGILLVVLGIAALGATTLTALVSVLMLGVALVVAGVVEVAQALRDRGRPHRGLHLTGGIFSMVAGGLLFARPAAGLVTVSLLLALYFMANGLFRSVGAAVDRFPGWGWDLAYGLSAIVIGLVVAGNLPASSLWLLGTLVALEILIRGAMLVALGLETRRQLRGQGPRPGLRRPLDHDLPAGAAPRAT